MDEKIEDGDFVLGFFDETSPQTAPNTLRLWSATHSSMKKNSTRIKANTFGFYALNGHSVLDFKQNSKKESVCEFLTKIREKNPEKKIMVVLDNFSSHRAVDTRQHANKLGIDLVFIPPYSPDLNPIEFVWKSIKRRLSRYLIKSEEIMKDLIQESFEELSRSLSFAKSWIKKFLNNTKLEKLSK